VIILAAPLTAAERPVRLLVVDSYHREYPWSAGIREGIAEVLDLAPSPSNLRISRDEQLVVRLFFMDTKRQADPAAIAEAGERAWQLIQDWQPDLIIASDDNAVRALVVPHLLGGPIPVVFCGVNWDAGEYGLPAANIAGMVEIDQIADLVTILRAHAAGDRLGYLLLDSVTGRRDIEGLRAYFQLDPVVRFVDSVAGWREAFVELQDEVDMLLIKQNVTGLPEWDLDEAVTFVQEHTRIPTGTTTAPMRRCAVVSIIKNPREQGRWAGETALAILAGADPASIPLAANRESRVFLNMELARRLAIQFPMELIERATFVEETWQP
jgi:ABC-type uncharacterized transport system substrate-binding protein